MSWNVPYRYRLVRFNPQEIELACTPYPLGASRNFDAPLQLDVTSDEYAKLFSCVAFSAERLFPDEGTKILWSLWRAIACEYVDNAIELDCINVPLYDPLINWNYGNPYTEPNPAGNLLPLWVRFPFGVPSQTPQIIIDAVAGIQEAFTGYQAGDVALFIGGYFSAGDIFNFFQGNIPGFSIEVRGNGTAFIDLLQVPLGGLAIISVDVEPNPLDGLIGYLSGALRIVELDRDFTQVVIENDATSLEEIIIEGGAEDELHTIRVWFIPAIDNTDLILGFGGGVRSVRLCGFDLTDYTPAVPEGLIVTTTEDLRAAIWPAIIRHLNDDVVSAPAEDETQFVDENQDGLDDATLLPEVAFTETVDPQSSGGADAVLRLLLSVLSAADDYYNAIYDPLVQPTPITEFLEYMDNIYSQAGDSGFFALIYFDYQDKGNDGTLVADVALSINDKYGDGIREAVYCGSASIKASLDRFIFTEVSAPDDPNDILQDALKALVATLDVGGYLQDAFDSGKEQPTYDFLRYNCYKRPDVIWILNEAAYGDILQNEIAPMQAVTWSGNRRLRVTASGIISATNNTDQSDPIYFHEGNGVFDRYDPWNLTIGGHNVTPPNSVELQRLAPNTYRWIADVGSVTNAKFMLGETTFDKNQMIQNPSGTLTYLIEDLGEIE